MIKRLLIANRGEIAVRIIKAAKGLGIETVAVYSDADRHALHVKLADQAVPIGPSPAAQSYLDVDAVLGAAKDTGADAVHPGYGFLSENAEFAKAATDAGLVFVGPPATVIAQMGTKHTARDLAEKAGVPVVPGYDGVEADDDTLAAEAKRIGTPLMIKATAGGGGRGLRRIDDLTYFTEALHSARREAGAAFGDTGIILERMVENARHVEVQILADSHGNVVHLYERDCSSQRRHQKVIEEAPAPAISGKTREGLLAASVKLAHSVGYMGAGTIEFLVDEAGDFYFLEMNTRLQVEHPVTEMITGIDLVAAQLRIAAGEKLRFTQDDIRVTGHAIEARLYAEDPAQAFMPQTGTLGVFDVPAPSGTRLDSGVQAGDEITPFYDPMLAKLIAHGATREDARQKLVGMIRDSRIAGMATNKTWLKHQLEDDPFATGGMRTHTLDHATPFLPLPPENQAMAIAMVMQAMALKDFPIRALAGWRTQKDSFDRRVFEVAGERLTVDTRQTQTALGWDITGTCQGKSRTAHFDGQEFIFKDQRASAAYCRNGFDHYVDFGPWHFAATDVTRTPADKSTSGGTGKLTAPMDGQIVAVPLEAGAMVRAGDLVCVIEAMKMEHHVRADIDGILTDLHASVGMQVKARAPLATITPEETA